MIAVTRSRVGERVDAARLGRRSDWLDVLISLSSADMRARYGRGRWRMLKWLLDPFAFSGVYLLVVVFLVNRPGKAPGLSITCAIVPFQLLAATVADSLDMVNRRRAIIGNVAFSRVLLPLAAVLTQAVAFGASLVLLVITMAAYAIPPTVAILWLPVLLATTLALAAGLAYPASLVGLWFPDLRPFAGSLMRALYFLATGLVALSQVHGGANQAVRLNPLTGLFEAYRATILYGRSPAAWELIYPLVFAAALLALSVPVYRREQAHFAKLLS